VRELAEQVNACYGDAELTVVGVMAGALPLVADLMGLLAPHVRVEVIQARSYRGTSRRAGRLELIHNLPASFRGRHVLVVDEVLESGQTLSAIVEEVRRRKPASVRSLVLLHKHRRDVEPAALRKRCRTEFVGFDCQDIFLVGYGLDCDGRCRNMPDIVALE
jgi:hypoxanthine phosphoribosyltransferase